MDNSEAARFYRQAADQGHAEAQNTLGHMYASGTGLPNDFVAAHMWFNLASAKGFEGAAASREEVAKRMTPDQITEAQRLAREWTPSN